MKPVVATVAAALLAVGLTSPVQAQSTPELKRMSLEELMSVDVSTVSRLPQPASDVPAAVYVITAEDIRRAGATTLPEILRLAPGVQVSRITSTLYAVGIRGFADRLSRSMLVLIDGRAVYSPLFAGTYWEVQDTLIADIDRIEVIRGPGGTLWGANAVNGIINIITKSASLTQGALAGVSLGTDGSRVLAGRYGTSHGQSGQFRLYGKVTDRDPEYHADGNGFDEFSMFQAGFRSDWTVRERDTLTVQGDVYGARLGQAVTLAKYSAPFADAIRRRSPLSGGNMLMRWSGRAGNRGTAQVQAYFDRTSRDELPIGETRNTFDVDVQYGRPLSPRHQLLFGAGYRMSDGHITANGLSNILPAERADQLVTAFLQDDISLVPDRVRLLVGAKVEHNSYSGAEIQPSVRLLWKVGPEGAAFASVTRAVRTPSRVETDYTTTALSDASVPRFVRLEPNPDFDSESLVAYEAGYRVHPVSRLYATVATFYNQHRRLLSTELLTSFTEGPPGNQRLIVPVMFKNGIDGESYGVEVTGDVRPAAWWRWIGNYSFERIEARKRPGSTDVTQATRYPGATPRHQMMLQTSLDLPAGLTADMLVSYRTAMTFGAVPAYATSTIRLAYAVSPALTLSIVGSNLQSARHLEWPVGGSTSNVEIERRVSMSLTWRR